MRTIIACVAGLLLFAGACGGNDEEPTVAEGEQGAMTAGEEEENEDYPVGAGQGGAETYPGAPSE